MVFQCSQVTQWSKGGYTMCECMTSVTRSWELKYIRARNEARALKRPGLIHSILWKMYRVWWGSFAGQSCHGKDLIKSPQSSLKGWLKAIRYRYIYKGRRGLALFPQVLEICWRSRMGQLQEQKACCPQKWISGRHVWNTPEPRFRALAWKCNTHIS